jgi:hypothetical protein
MRKIAEGEILVHTQKSGQNVDSLRQYLASLRAESQRTGTSLDQLAKSIFMANAKGASLGRVIKGLASAAGFGGFGAAAYLAVDKMTRGIVTAQEESDKLAESLNKAVGAKAADSIEGTTQKMQSLTSVINETRGAIGKQGIMNSIAAFFFNDDADKAAKAFEKAVETRIALGDKLTQQEAERIAQQKIIMGLDDEMAKVFKINLETRKKLSQIEANDNLTAQQKAQQSELAREEQSDKLRQLRVEKEKDANKKIFEEKKKSDEEFVKISLKINESLIKQEDELFKKNAENYKKSQDEKVKAAEEANKKILESSRKASESIQKSDQQAAEQSRIAQQADIDVLGGSRAGKERILPEARRRRELQLKREDFRTQNAILGAEASRLSKIEGRVVTKQDIRNRIAKRVAAGESPALAEKLQASASGLDASQVSRSVAESRMKAEGQELPNLLKKVENILQTLSVAPLVTSGS